jgi:hypothetical protein
MDNQPGELSKGVNANGAWVYVIDLMLVVIAPLANHGSLKHGHAPAVYTLTRELLLKGNAQYS